MSIFDREEGFGPDINHTLSFIPLIRWSYRLPVQEPLKKAEFDQFPCGRYYEWAFNRSAIYMTSCDNDLNSYKQPFDFSFVLELTLIDPALNHNILF